MLFGLGQGSNIEHYISESMEQDPLKWNFDKKSAKENRIEAVFHELGWGNLYNKQAWWDFFGWDRAVRMWRVKSAIREISTEKKVSLLPCIRILLRQNVKLDKLQQDFPFYKRKELEAIKDPNSPLQEATESNWKELKRRAPEDCDEETFDRILALPKAEIPRLCALIEGEVPAQEISRKDRRTLLELAALYRDLQDKRATLPSRIQNLFGACDRSKLILFAIERSIHGGRGFFAENHNPKVVEDLNLRATGNTVPRPGQPGKIVLKSLFDLGDHLFRNRTFRIVKHVGDGEVRVIPVENSMESLCSALSQLSSSRNESFNRAVESALLEYATSSIVGTRVGGLQWKLQELTRPFLGDAAHLSQRLDSDEQVTEILDYGNREVDVRHTAKVDIQQNPMGIHGPILGTYGVACNYLISPDQQNQFSIEKVDVEEAQFAWDPERSHPFVKLELDGVELPDLQQLYLDDIAFNEAAPKQKPASEAEPVDMPIQSVGSPSSTDLEPSATSEDGSDGQV